MLASSFETTLRHLPFRPFDIHADGRTVAVDHPEQVGISPDKSTIVMIGSDGQLHILDMKRISSLTIKMRLRRGSTKAAA